MDVSYGRGNLERAQNLAAEYLELADQYKKDWNYGNAIHHGNLMLGKIVLDNHQFDLAKKHLLPAGDTPGSPHLS